MICYLRPCRGTSVRSPGRFRAGFDSCPAFTPQTYTAIDRRYRLAITDWAWSSVMTSGYQIPDALLARFPEPIRLFFTSSRTVAAPR